MSIESVIPSNHFILCRPFLFLPSIFLSIRVFSSESVLCIRWPKHWSFSYSSVGPKVRTLLSDETTTTTTGFTRKGGMAESHLTNNCLFQGTTPRGRFSAWSPITPAFLLDFFQRDFPSGTGASEGSKKVLRSLHIQT